MRERLTLPSTRMTMSSVKPTTRVLSVASIVPPLAGRPTGRLAGGDPPLELAHGLLHQLEGFLHRAVDDEGAQVRIGLLLLGREALRRIDGRVGDAGALLGQGHEPRRAGEVGADVVDSRQVEKGRDIGERPSQQHEGEQDAEGGTARTAMAAAPDLDESDERDQNRHARSHQAYGEEVDRDRRREWGQPVQHHADNEHARRKQGDAARPARQRRDNGCRSVAHGLLCLDAHALIRLRALSPAAAAVRPRPIRTQPGETPTSSQRLSARGFAGEEEQGVQSPSD